MNLKNKNYMQSKEFSARQSWFEFVCVKGYEFVKNFVKDCRSGWKKIIKGTKMEFMQLALNFEKRNYSIKEQIIDVWELEYFGIGSGWCVLSRKKEERYCKKTKREKFPNVFKSFAPQ